MGITFIKHGPFCGLPLLFFLQLFIYQVLVSSAFGFGLLACGPVLGLLLLG
jgi:hypothetical protein